MEVDEETYTITIDGMNGLASKSLKMNVKEMKKNFAYAEVVAALQVIFLIFRISEYCLNNTAFPCSAQAIEGKKWERSNPSKVLLGIAVSQLIVAGVEFVCGISFFNQALRIHSLWKVCMSGSLRMYPFARTIHITEAPSH